MATVKEHYDGHLGPVYSWMLGGMPAAMTEAMAELRELQIDGMAPGVALDLGAGPGAYAIPLAELGFSVNAIDTCEELLQELASHTGEAPIEAVHADLTPFMERYADSADVILCMGDTLTHLESREAVSQLLRDVQEALSPGGIFVTSFRDFASAPPQGVERFIPVRSDEQTILTCFLEYGEERVTVYDILQTNDGSGWTTRVSDYLKLRLDPAWVRAELQRIGLQASLGQGTRGMVRVTAKA